MKRFSIALLALATALAIVPAAMASPVLCTAYPSAVTTGTVCYEGNYTFDFIAVSITAYAGGPGTDTLSFNSGTTSPGDPTVLGFQVGGLQPDDFNMVYSVTGPAVQMYLDNSQGGGLLSEYACTGYPSCGINLTGTFYNTASGVEVYSPGFTSPGTFYVNKDWEDVVDVPGVGYIQASSELTDSIDFAPEPTL